MFPTKKLKAFWTYFPGFTRSISRLVHPANHPTSLPQVMAPWTDFELKQRKPTNVFTVGGCPGSKLSNKQKSLKRVKRTRTVLTCCTKNASAIETFKIAQESHILQITHSHLVMEKISCWYNEVAPLNSLIRSPFHHSPDIPFFALQPLQNCLSVSVTLGIRFNKMEKWCQEMPLEFTDFYSWINHRPWYWRGLHISPPKCFGGWFPAINHCCNHLRGHFLSCGGQKLDYIWLLLTIP